MTQSSPAAATLSAPVPFLPAWVGSSGIQDLDRASFQAGATLGHLDLALRIEAVPQAIWRARLALAAAEAVVGFTGRRETAADLRDALHFRRAGDLPGPAGAIYLAWQRAVAGRITVPALQRALTDQTAAEIAGWLDAGQGAPVDQGARVLETVLRENPRAESAALLLADAALARALGWAHLVPLLAVGLKRSDLRKQDADLRLACHRAVVTAVITALPLASDLARRADTLRQLTPKLRAKQAEAAVALFLAQDVLAPMALPLPDRAARRLCDRLVDLGAVRELTGRETFRLYGL